MSSGGKHKYRKRDNKLREYLANAAKQLEAKQLEYHHLVAVTELLKRRVALLHEVADESSPIALAQQLATKTLSLALQQPCMQARLCKRPAAVWPEGLEVSENAISVEALPLGLSAYNEALLERMARMTAGDCLFVLRSFVERCGLAHGQETAGSASTQLMAF